MKSKSNTEYIKIGIISDAHGLRGEVYVVVFSGDTSWIEDLEEVQLMPPGQTAQNSLKNYSVKKIKPFKKGFIAQFETINDRNQSDLLKKYEVWVPADLFVSEDGEQPYLSEFLNFNIEDKQLGNIGSIESFSTNNYQDLFIINKKINGQNIEIPFVKEFIVEIDYANKIMHMNLPEGLVQINEKD
ncbi:MAG: ribosome maturation factor RimM [Pseudobdellovibrio sp.]